MFYKAMAEYKTIAVKPSLSMTFQPEAWNGQNIVRKVNCVAYAFNAQEIGFPFIWNMRRKTRLTAADKTAEEHYTCAFSKVTNSVISNDIRMRFAGLEPIRKHQFDPAKRHIIGFSPNMNHFYRLDGNNLWSHKNGVQPAVNTDDDGNLITDLDEAQLGLPEQSCREERRKRELAHYLRHAAALDQLRLKDEKMRTITGRFSLALRDKIFTVNSLGDDISMPHLSYDNTKIYYYALPEDGLHVIPN